jgi:hypothetical protein
VADLLSKYQDAVGEESYLGTAWVSRRSSVASSLLGVMAAELRKIRGIFDERWHDLVEQHSADCPVPYVEILDVMTALERYLSCLASRLEEANETRTADRRLE